MEIPQANDPRSSGPTLPLRPVGSNHVGMRQFNERIVLQAIRLHGSLPKAEVARLTRLSAQTASVIINGLLKDGLVMKQERVRGRIGQPSVPIALDPDGAFSLGIKVGRRGLDVLAMDFAGKIRFRESLAYDYPEPSTVFGGIEERIASIQTRLGAHAQRLVGAGVAAPLWLGGWRDFLSAPAATTRDWESIDIREEIQRMTTLPVEFAKDTAAACAAELVMGQGRNLRNFLYLFIGTFIGGGLVVDGNLHFGPRGNAGAVGSLPLPGERGEPGRQVLHKASGLVLEQSLTKEGISAAGAHDERALAGSARPLTDRWLAEACPALALTVASAAALLDLDAVILDGSLHRDLIGALIAGTDRELDRYNWEGIQRAAILPGSIGADARALGGAILPLYAHFAPTHEHLLKAAPG